MLTTRRTAVHRILVRLAALTMLAVTGPAVGTAQAATCPTGWGSLPESASVAGRAPNELTGVRAGRHECSDRLVLDVAGKTSWYRVQYVSQVRADGSGEVVPLRGAGKLEVIVMTPAYDENGDPTYPVADPANLVRVAGWTTFRQVAWAGSFEGMTTVGLGVRARLPFRVQVLDGPGSTSRVVIDVAHRW